MPLSQFAEPIESASGVFKAYRMDSTEEESDMRRAAGLGTCECCDYVTVSKDNQSVVLIEETNLKRTKAELEKKYAYLEEDDQVELFYDQVLRENRLKLYGSMLILCRLSSSREDVQSFLPENKLQFWLVTTSTDSSDFVLLDHLTDNLRGFLKTTLPKEMMNVVDIIPSTELAEKLSAQAYGNRLKFPEPCPELAKSPLMSGY